jgi:DNA-binding GntR family transcriptional regulator
MEAGTWLRQEFLAQKLEVSQATIREALNQLASEGLVAHIPHKGVKVVTISADALEDIYDMRALLEGLANELAATELSETELAQMRELLPQILLTQDSPSTVPAREADREFHWIAIRATKRDHLIRVLEQLWVLIDPYMVYSRFWNVSQAWEQRIKASKLDLQDHTQLLQALEARNGEKARGITEKYVHRAFKELEQQILEAQNE